MSSLRALIRLLALIWHHPLHVGHRFAALANFLRWQLGTRLLGRKVIVPWVDDTCFITGRGEAGLTGNVYLGLLEYEDMGFLLHVLRPADTFIDVGANVGAYTLLAAGVVGANTMAFEPVPSTVARLKDQIAINRLEAKVEIHNAGVGRVPGELHFTNNNDTVNRVSLEGEGPGTSRVAVTTLDIALEPILRAGGRFAIKVDVEGFEYEVLSGATQTLAATGFTALVIELNGSGAVFGHSDQKIHELLTAKGLIAVGYDPRSRALGRLSGHNATGNTIYVRDIAVVEGLCRSAPKRRVHSANDVLI